MGIVDLGVIFSTPGDESEHSIRQSYRVYLSVVAGLFVGYGMSQLPTDINHRVDDHRSVLLQAQMAS